jgi:hypothetical protein
MCGAYKGTYYILYLFNDCIYLKSILISCECISKHYFIFGCNGPHGLAIIKKHLKNLPALFSNINIRDVMLQQHSCKLDIQY